MNKVIFIPGHTENHPGARAWNGLGEYHYNAGLSWELATIEGASVARRYYDNYDRYVDSLGNYLPKDVLKIELHFNSSTVSNVQGTEALVSGKNYKVTSIAETLCERFSNEFGLRNRGVKLPSGRGNLILNNIPNTIIFEPFFAHERDDINQMLLENPTLVAKFWENFVNEYL